MKIIKILEINNNIIKCIYSNNVEVFFMKLNNYINITKLYNVDISKFNILEEKNIIKIDNDYYVDKYLAIKICIYLEDFYKQNSFLYSLIELYDSYLENKFMINYNYILIPYDYQTIIYTITEVTFCDKSKAYIFSECKVSDYNSNINKITKDKEIDNLKLLYYSKNDNTNILKLLNIMYKINIQINSLSYIDSQYISIILFELKTNFKETEIDLNIIYEQLMIKNFN